LPETVKSVLTKTGASDADLSALDLLTGGASLGSPLMGLAAWKRAKIPREVIEALQQAKNPMHQAINEKNVVYHATDINRFKDILESGEIRPGGLPSVLDMSTKGMESGVSVSRVPRVNSKEEKAISFVIDKEKIPRTRQYV
jgi:hypothetical protein